MAEFIPPPNPDMHFFTALELETHVKFLLEKLGEVSENMLNTNINELDPIPEGTEYLETMIEHLEAKYLTISFQFMHARYINRFQDPEPDRPVCYLCGKDIENGQIDTLEGLQTPGCTDHEYHRHCMMGFGIDGIEDNDPQCDDCYQSVVEMPVADRYSFVFQGGFILNDRVEEHWSDTSSQLVTIGDNFLIVLNRLFRRMKAVYTLHQQNNEDLQDYRLRWARSFAAVQNELPLSLLRMDRYLDGFMRGWRTFDPNLAN